MKKATKITRQERFDIRSMLDSKWSYRKIARQLNRSPNTITQEVSGNSTNGCCDPIKADAKAKAKRRGTRLKWRKIEDDSVMKKYIVAKLKKHWNPDEIAGAMKEGHLPFYVSKTTIYEWLFSVWLRLPITRG